MSGAWDEVLLDVKDWVATIAIGYLIPSFWRGTWVLFDIWLCGQPADAGLVTGDSFCFAGIIEDTEIALHRKSGWISLLIGVSLTAIGVVMMWMGLWRPKVVDIQDKVHLPWTKTALRIIMVYILGVGAVNWWRGVWYLTDYFLLPNNLTANEWGEWPLTSFWTASVVGSSVCFLLFSGPSILAPPGIWLFDGPGVNPPPIAVTIASSYYSVALPAGAKIPELSIFIIIADVITSFLIVPFFVVWYWRGSWLVLDFYLYGFSPEPRDVHLSIAWSTILGLGLMFLTSETVFAFIHVKNRIVLALLGRLRTYLLAWGVVNFWRAVWYIWDEFCGGTSQWSAWIAHIVPLILLAAVDCFSCILAPASTLGVDAVPNPEAADDPLFSNLPIPTEDIVPFGIGREPQELEEDALTKETLENQKHHIRMSISATSGMAHAAALAALEDTEEAGDVEMTGVKKATEEEEEEEFADIGDDVPPETVKHEVEVWSSGGTGRRASYSSVRTSAELAERRSSYFEIQRPDLDRRISRTSSITSASGKMSRRRSSDLFRSR